MHLLNKIEKLCDVGTGAGFPGVVLKIVYPNLKVTLIDSLQKRVNYLNEIVKELELEEIQKLINFIYSWYEIKYPEKELEMNEGIRYFEFINIERNETEINMMSPLTWAYVGDCVYELYIRTRLINKTNLKPHKQSYQVKFHRKSNRQ